MAKQLLVLLTALLLVNKITAQLLHPDSLAVQDSAVQEAISVYHHYTGLQSQLYNGKTHIGYDPNMQGSAYYLSNDMQTGTIEYENIVFNNVPLRYDEVGEKVVVQHFNRISSFELTSEKVSRFSIGDHAFVRIEPKNSNDKNAPPAGFYEVLFSGDLTVFARRKKLVAEYIENMEVKRRIDNKESFYARRNGVFYPVNNERSLMAVMKDKENQVHQYLRKNKLKFRKTPDLVLTQAAVYYHQITH